MPAPGDKLEDAQGSLRLYGRSSPAGPFCLYTQCSNTPTRMPLPHDTAHLLAYYPRGLILNDIASLKTFRQRMHPPTPPLFAVHNDSGSVIQPSKTDTLCHPNHSPHVLACSFDTTGMVAFTAQ